MVNMLPRLLLKGLTGRPLALASFLDLLVPPLSLLAMAATLVMSLLLADYLLRDDPVPLFVSTAAMGLATLGLAVCWLRFGRNSLSIADIAYIPRYVASKLTMYLAMPFRPMREWKRTERLAK